MGYNFPLVGQNAGYFDRGVTERHLGFTPKLVFDNVLGHRLHNPEVPHSLAFQGSEFTDAPAWKAEHTATSTANDLELGVYCGRDCAVTARATPYIIRSMRERGQAHLYAGDAIQQEICLGAHRQGFKVDTRRVLKHLKEQEFKRLAHLEVVKAFAGDDFNINSTRQLRSLIYDTMGLPILAVTKTGEPSADKNTMIALACDPKVRPEHARVLNHIRWAKRADKVIGTYLLKWLKAGLTEGRIWPNYLAHGTPTGRWSSNGPNTQNVPFFLRDCLVADDHVVFVYCDQNQLELRVCVGQAGAAAYQATLLPGAVIEPHNLTGELMMGDAIYWGQEGAPEDRTQKGSGKFKKARDLAKIMFFLSLYMGSPMVGHTTLRRMENSDGELIYSKMTLNDYKRCYNRWLKNAPEFKTWWEEVLGEHAAKGYTVDPVSGRRCDFRNGQNPNAIINWIGQAGGAAIVRIATEQMYKSLPFDQANLTGFRNQTHDSVVVACVPDRLDFTRQAIEDAMSQRHFDTPFSGETMVMHRFKEEPCPKCRAEVDSRPGGWIACGSCGHLHNYDEPKLTAFDLTDEQRAKLIEGAPYLTDEYWLDKISSVTNTDNEDGDDWIRQESVHDTFATENARDDY